MDAGHREMRALVEEWLVRLEGEPERSEPGPP
jgi:hypothetical protein